MRVSFLIGEKMANYVRPKTRQLSSHSERKTLREEAHNKNIVEVAQQLGMSLERIGKDYQWKEHDSLKIDTRKNYFYWNAQGFGGDPIKLAQTIMECSYGEAVRFLTGKEISKFDKALVPKREFSYKLKDSPNPVAMRDYLKNERYLSDETINYFIKQGVLSQANFKDIGTERYDPVIVFKHFDSNHKMQGMALQGTQNDFELYPSKGKLKKTIGDGLYGCVVKVGNPPVMEGDKLNSNANVSSEQNPLKIIVFEAPIDMMSYYELFKDKIGDAYLMAMSGLKKGAVSTFLAEKLTVKISQEKKEEFLDFIQNSTNGTKAVKIILAVDNDEAGKKFINNFGIKKIPVVPHLAKLAPGAEKADWNELLQRIKKPQKTPFEERLKKAAEARPDFATRLRQVASMENMKHR